jgi:diguanylate cyclase (GGDEF)-like protein
MRRRHSLTYSLAWQFAAIVVPFTVLLLYQAWADLSNADAVTFELQCVTIAQRAYGEYTRFLNAAADAGDTSTLSVKGFVALQQSRASLVELRGVDPHTPVEPLIERIDMLRRAVDNERTLAALLPVRTTANEVDKLLASLVDLHRQRSRERIERIAHEARTQAWLLCLALALAIGIVYALVRKLSEPLYRAVAFASSLAAGHFKDVGKIDLRRDIGGLLASLDAMQLNLRRAFHDLAEQRKRLAHAQHIAKLGDWTIDVSSGSVTRSDELYAILKRAPGEMPASSVVPPEIIHAEDREKLRDAFAGACVAGTNFSIDFRIVAPEGEIRFLNAESKVENDAGGRPLKVAGVLQDISERKAAAAHIERLAQFDSLTGLPNRTLFNDRLAQMLTLAKRSHWVAGVVFVDLDRFKAINDTYGHGAGDRLLKLVAQRLQACIRSGDTVGRLAGDEFAIALATLAKAEDADLVAQKVVDALARPFDIGDVHTFVTASLGIALYPVDGEDADSLLRNADTAMYRAKEQGRNAYQFYTPEMNERVAERLRTETLLRGALERGEFVLHFQPKANLMSGEISGFEALLRWEHPVRGLVAPHEFIPILEDTGLIVTVGEWVLREACEQIVRWQAARITPRPIAVNVSARQFRREGFDAVLAKVLAQSGIDPALLELELTESTLMSDTQEAVRMLDKLRAPGVRLALDDFGTGYSSLAYLRTLPVHTLKIDRAFIRDVATDPDAAGIVIAMIALAHGMKLSVVAEGVETEAQLNFLRLRGCDEMQGYYFARPMPAAECTRALVENRRLPPALTAQSSAPAVLLVDDSLADLEMLKRALSPDGYRIMTAATPGEAFEALAKVPVEIVLSDYRMPGMDGVEFLAGVRRLYPASLRIMVSGAGEMDTVIQAVNEAGVHKYLSKDTGAARICTAVREAYARHRSELLAGEAPLQE